MEVKRRPKKKSWEEAYDYIKNKIFKMKLKPGEMVSEYSLAKELNMSRTPVREALKKLEQEGLIISSPNGRKRVFILTIKDINDIFDLKETLEVSIVRWATERGSEEDIEKLRKVVEEMVRISREKQRYLKENAEEKWLKEWMEVDVQFHELLYKMAGNKRAELFVKNLNDQWQRLRQAILVIEGRIEKSSEEHREIFQSIAKRDVKAAEEAMLSHLRNIRRMLLSVMKAFNFPEE